MAGNISDEAILELLHTYTGMALGCTEPIAAALSVVKAREILGYVPEKISLRVSGNIYKNGMGVGIPGTTRRGIKIAAALGALTGSSERSLEVLEGVTDEIATQAVEMVEKDMVDIEIAYNVDKLYINATLSANGHTASATVEHSHTNITTASKDGTEVFTGKKEKCSYAKTSTGRVEGLSVERIYQWAKTVDIEKLDCITSGAEANWAIADAGLKKRYGYSLGKTLAVKSRTDADLMRNSMARVAAGIDARMSGSMLPVMTNSGSGNQGITIYVPVINTAVQMGVSNEEMIRALAFANMIPIHIKQQIGPLSALCGIVPASIGAACGIAYLRDATLCQIKNVIQLIIANISGLFCDGAKASCSMKASVGIAAAYEALYIAIDGNNTALCDGIISPDVEKSIDNLSRIAISAMDSTDTEIINIMTCK
ncbi:MAG: L-serine ammonia-lyase, iron-sulfur-dependent, subunit alpha [Flavobacteriales bacterium]|nr:L-serine ammonia-lyase, iron-sulfur-dependent, subunit alpha [Flavobacteriales bacterium]